MRGSWSRLGFAAALALAALVQLDQLARTLRWHGRLRAQYVRTIESSIRARLPQLALTLGYGGAAARAAALGAVRVIQPQAEVELFDYAGHRLAAVPHPAPVAHHLDGEPMRAVSRGGLFTVGPVGDGEQRLLTYVALSSGQDSVVMRVAVPVPELAQQAEERRELILGHSLALFALAVAGVLALLPGRAQGEPESPRALEAYVAAMNRLGELGRVRTEQHAAERQRLEEQIRLAGPMARAGELTSGIVHELRNGLGTIVGYARLIEQAGPEAAREAATAIRAECEALEVFVRRFMEFVKDETPTVGPVDVRRMLSRVASREAAARAGAEVSIAPGPDIELAGDEELLERAFENLVRNAREAAGPSGHVVIQARREGAEAALTVADDGPGLTPAERDALRPFRTTKAGGSGLGLPLAMKIVKLHGGVLTMASRSPRGLSVTVHLPVGRPPAG